MDNNLSQQDNQGRKGMRKAAADRNIKNAPEKSGEEA